MVKLFVYGTLKKRKRNNYLLKRSKFLRKKELKGIQLFSNKGYNYPISIEKKNAVAIGELYNLTNKTFKEIKDMENLFGYVAIQIEKILVFVLTKDTYKTYITVSSKWKPIKEFN